MTKTMNLFAILSLPVLALASCSGPTSGDSAMAANATASSDPDERISFTSATIDTVDEPWAQAFVPGTNVMFVTLKAGSIKAYDIASGRAMTVTGAPQVAYGGQGGLGDIAFLPGEEGGPDGRTIYLSWAEAGSGGTYGAVVGRGTLACPNAAGCAIQGLNVIWRQSPKVEGQGHYSHRLAFSPDGEYLFVTSGDRQKQDPAQDTGNNLGTVVRLLPDGTPAPGNPLADRGSPSDQIWSWGHRNLLGIAFDGDGRLWQMEHGPAGGDELNIIKRGGNYGWPVRSGGENYDGTPIPDHSPDDGFVKPVINWTPVIAPGNFTFYEGNLFPALAGDILLSGLKTEALIHVAVDGANAREVARYPMDRRIRSVIDGPDGALYVLEDGDGARVLRLTPSS